MPSLHLPPPPSSYSALCSFRSCLTSSSPSFFSLFLVLLSFPLLIDSCLLPASFRPPLLLYLPHFLSLLPLPPILIPRLCVFIPLIRIPLPLLRILQPLLIRLLRKPSVVHCTQTLSMKTRMTAEWPGRNKSIPHKLKGGHDYLKAHVEG